MLLNRFLILFSLSMMIACSPIRLPNVTYDITVASRTSQTLSGAIAIPEVELLSLRNEASPEAAYPTTVKDAIQTAALANSPEALGIEGPAEHWLHVSKDSTLLVMRDPQLTKHGNVQSKDFYVASVNVDGAVRWGIRNPRLLLTAVPVHSCGTTYRGCQPVSHDNLSPLSAAISSDETGGIGPTQLNVEAAQLPKNGMGKTIELVISQGQRAERRESRFACAMPIESSSCSNVYSRDTPVSSRAQSYMKLPSAARVIAESDFETLIGREKLSLADSETRTLAAAVTSAANYPSALGLEARRLSESGLDTDFLVVARDIHLKDELINATSYFIVPARIKDEFPFTLVGGDIRIAFREPTQGVDFSQGLCGPVFIPNGGTICPEGLCVGSSQRWAPEFGGFGMDRQIKGMNRISLRFPVTTGGSFNLGVATCSLFLPPKPQNDLKQVSEPQNALKPVPEECNGRDDNGDGQIDELACEGRGVCACVPRSCGSLRCMTIPDGCGQLLTCPCN